MTAKAKTTAAKKTPARKQVAKPAPAEDAYSDAVLAELEADLQGAPAMHGLHQLSRRNRAELLEKVYDLLPRLESDDQVLAQATASGKSADADAKASVVMLNLIADAEDILAIAAVDEEAFRLWSERVDDRDLLALFYRVVKDLNSGEASSSSS